MYRDGVSDEDRRRLFQHAKLSTMDQDAVNGLTYLGSRVMRVRFIHFAFLHAESDLGLCAKFLLGLVWLGRPQQIEILSES